MRLVMMGTGPFAVPTFISLLDRGAEVVALFTRPMPPVRGRGPAPPNPMRDAAESRGIQVFAPDGINTPDAQSQLEALRPDLLIVCDYGQILKSETLAIAPLGGINLHGSLLPKYRGAAPVHWAIWSGDVETGVTVIHMTPLLDGGPILAVAKTPIGPDETTAELEPRLAELGVPLVQQSIEQLQKWDRTSPIGQRQDPALTSKAPRLKKTDGAIDWSQSATRIRNQIRALKPWPGTYSHWLRAGAEPLRLIIDSVSPAGDVPPNFRPGQVVLCDGKRLLIATGDGLLSLDRVQPAGKRILEIEEFLRGYPVRVGDSWGSAPA